MKKIFTLLTALILVGAVHAQSYRVMNIHKNGEISQTVKLSDIDSMTVTSVGEDIPDTPVIPEDPHEYVDLGLPSGTLWATCNIGAEYPTDGGNYFAWGETATKHLFSCDNYKWCEGSMYTLTKYNTSSSHGSVVDDKKRLEAEDDAATVLWGPNWCMPTSTQIAELMNKNHTTFTWTTMSTPRGGSMNGYKIVSKYNDNFIFLPAVGYRDDGETTNEWGAYGYYWSSDLSSEGPNTGYSLFFKRYKFEWTGATRAVGHSIRPVRVLSK